MSTATDEIDNLVQHTRDVAAKIGGDLAQDARGMLARITGQIDDLASKIKQDAQADVAEAGTDVHQAETDAQQAASHTVSSPVPNAADTTDTATTSAEPTAQS